jgi:2-isopropylmalate synthase
LEAAVKAVSYAKKHMDYIEFSAEDASRSDPEFLIQIFREVIRAGGVVIRALSTATRRRL